MNISEYSNALSIRQLSDKKKRNLIVFLVSLFPVVLSALCFAIIVVVGNISFPEKIGAKSEFGEVIIPADKSIITNKFPISGVLSNIPQGQWIYLLENREGLFWPQFSLGNKEGSWSKSLIAYGKKGHFSSYLLVKVDTKNKQVFDDWFETSRITGKYPGMADIEFAEIVAKIRVKTK